MPDREGRIQRIVGCLVAGAIGDAWGSPYEGMPAPVAVELDRDWVLTDDTQLTLSTCDAIVAGSRVDAEQIAGAMASAFSSGSVVGLGASTYHALESLAAGGHWALVGRKGDRAAGNGAAMRVAPLAFCLDLGAFRGRQLLRDVCRITHHNDEAYVGALAIALAVQAASMETWKGGAGLIAQVAQKVPDSAVRDRLRELEVLDPFTPLPQVAAKYGSSGYVVESVPLALFAAQQAHGADFAAWLWNIIEVGGDTDTIASMAGQVAGCALGVGRIPAALIARIPGIEELRKKMSAFAHHVAAAEMHL